jgi:hypothetical protein
MISQAELERKLYNVLSKSKFQNIENVAILPGNDGSYQVFGRYTVIKQDSNNIIVKLFNGDMVNSFYSMKSAICWCVFDKRGLYSSANRIINLDNKLSGLDVGISIHSKLIDKSKDMNDKFIYLAKLNEEKLQKRDMTAELNRYINDSYSWQQKQFDLKTKH